MILIEGLSKSYGTKNVLDRLDLSVDAGEIRAIVGPSGAGKSTLAQCVTLLERPTSGSVFVNGVDLTALGAAHLREARRRIGTIFQRDGLFARRTAAANVALPLEYLGVTRSEIRTRVGELLERVGLGDRAGAFPHELSGGQRQRVGIARALALRPSVLLSDEATSGLDPDSTASILALLRELRDDLGLAILFITHEMDAVVEVADSVAALYDGRIAESGTVVELLRDPSSPLGSLLRPTRPYLSPRAGDEAWQVSYRSGAVEPDWLLRLGTRLGEPISLLGAAVETVGGEPVGRAVIGIPAPAVEDLRAALDELGLDGAPASAVLPDAIVLEKVA